jgi:tagatose-1,6-bisphosphate aldolase
MGVQKLTSAEKRWVVVETARRLTPMGVDVLKAEFPLEITEEPDEVLWAQACRELTQASTVPWVLLSAGVSFEDFLRQTTVACQQGASGVLAGRAVWKEAVQLKGETRQVFLKGTARERLAQLAALVRQEARPWIDFHPGLADSVQGGWHLGYTAPCDAGGVD